MQVVFYQKHKGAMMNFKNTHYKIFQWVFTLLAPSIVQAVTVNIVSDATWSVLDTNMNDLGTAQQVCLSPTSPANCPTTATKYGYPYPGWNTNLTTIPGAKWIWASNITGATTGAANATFIFTKQFYLCGSPTSGSISVAADNAAEVFLNGISIGTSSGFSTLSTFTISASKIAAGLNVIKIQATNAANPPNCIGNYQCNPAAMVFGASFADALPAWPTCTEGNGTKVTVGTSEVLSCRPAEVGNASRTCICIGTGGATLWTPAEYSGCHQPPKTCTGNNGKLFNAGEKEALSCPAGQTGSSSHTCQNDGIWAAGPNSCTLPPKTCTGNGGAIFVPGQSENLACDVGQTGSNSRRCQTDGTWAAGVSTCALPKVNKGDLCGGITNTPPVFATCPSGTTCGHRALPTGPKPWTCFFGINCPVKLWTTDWFCD
ncbi:MAG: hypothetical protein ABI036_18860 [Fibrobacteria bacterium]